MTTMCSSSDFFLPFHTNITMGNVEVPPENPKDHPPASAPEQAEEVKVPEQSLDPENSLSKTVQSRAQVAPEHAEAADALLSDARTEVLKHYSRFMDARMAIMQT